MSFVKFEKGVYITPAFPKLIYVLEEDNIREGSKYWELTKLAAKCTAKTSPPRTISHAATAEYVPTAKCFCYQLSAEKMAEI